VKSKLLGVVWIRKHPRNPVDADLEIIPPTEKPICCPETRKDPTVQKPVFPSGSFECPPEEGGCGSIWREWQGVNETP